jgi:hypothetical protein
MKRPNFFSLMVVLITFFACTQRQSLSVENLPVLKIDMAPAIKKTMHIDQFVVPTSIKIVTLETDHQQSVFSEASYFYVLKDQFLIADKQLKRIMLFRSDGTFVRLIGQHGRGPEEFTDVYKLSYNPFNDRVEIFDSNLQFTQYEVSSGNFVERRKFISTDFYNGFFHPSSSDSYILYNGLIPTSGRSDLRYRLGYVKDQKVVWKKFEYSSQEEGLNFVNAKNPFWDFEGRVGFFEPFIPVLYEVNEKGVEPRLSFDFLDGNTPPFEVNHISSYIENKEKVEGNVWLFSVLEGNHYLFVEFSVLPKMVRTHAFIRKTEEGFQTIGLGGGYMMFQGMPIFIKAIEENTVFGMIQAQYVIEKQKELKLRDPNSLTPFEQQLLSLEVEDTDNDLICSFLLK